MGSSAERQADARLGCRRSRDPGFPLTTVLDANVVLYGAGEGVRLDRLDDDLVAPPLLWPEVRSVLHVMVVRGAISETDARSGLDLLDSGLIRARAVRTHDVWEIAGELGWSKTYDAEYLALCARTRAPLLTFDRRMISAARRVGLDAQAPR